MWFSNCLMCYRIILEMIKRCHINKNISVIFALSSFFYVLKIKDQGTFCCLVCKLVHVCLFTLFNYESCKFIPSHIFLNYKSIWSDKKVLIIGNCQWRVQVTYRGQRYNLPPLDFVIFGHMMFQKDILNWYIFWYCNTCTIGTNCIQSYSSSTNEKVFYMHCKIAMQMLIWDKCNT